MDPPLAEGMYSFAHARRAGILVSYWKGTHNSEADYDRLLSVWRTADADAQDRLDGLVHVMVIEPENPRPDAAQRKRIADFHQTLVVQRTHFLLVTTSPLIRGVVTAIQWLSRNDRMSTTVHATAEDAFRKVDEARRCGPRLLQNLLDEARGRIPTARVARAG